jgi:hypothetical protein
VGPDLSLSIIGAAASLVAGASTNVIWELLRNRLKRKESEKPYSERLAELTGNLLKASREVDAVLVELARVAQDRAKAVQQLEADLATMEGREKELKERVEALEKTPLAVAEHFATLVAPGERRSAVRDYLLFGAGVVVSTVIGIAIQVLAK